MDISIAVRARLPRPLKEKLEEIEAVIGRRVLFRQDATIPAGAGGSASLREWSVRLASSHVADLSVIGEEIMHLHRWATGFPVIEPREGAHAPGCARGLTQLAGHFDEVAFFPFLEGLGLDPRAQLTPTLAPAARALRAALPEIEADGATAEWRVLLAVTYVQAKLIAPESSRRDEFLSLLESRDLASYAGLGRLLSEEVVRASTEGPHEVQERMERCVRGHLQLSSDAATIWRPLRRDSRPSNFASDR